jgi:hypothetical protein
MTPPMKFEQCQSSVIMPSTRGLLREPCAQNIGDLFQKAGGLARPEMRNSQAPRTIVSPRRRAILVSIQQRPQTNRG